MYVSTGLYLSGGINQLVFENPGIVCCRMPVHNRLLYFVKFKCMANIMCKNKNEIHLKRDSIFTTCCNHTI